MKTYTPGPYRIGQTRNGEGLDTKIHAPDQTILARLDPWRGESHDEEMANAALFSAAPDMDAALRRCIPWLGKLIANGGHLDSVAPNDAIGALQQAEAAIAKATGGTK